MPLNSQSVPNGEMRTIWQRDSAAANAGLAGSSKALSKEHESAQSYPVTLAPKKALPAPKTMTMNEPYKDYEQPLPQHLPEPPLAGGSTMPYQDESRNGAFRYRDPYENWEGNPDAPQSPYRRFFWEEPEVTHAEKAYAAREMLPPVNHADTAAEKKPAEPENDVPAAEAKNESKTTSELPVPEVAAPSFLDLANAVNPNASHAAPPPIEHKAQPKRRRRKRAKRGNYYQKGTQDALQYNHMDKSASHEQASGQSAAGGMDMPPPFWQPLETGASSETTPQSQPENISGNQASEASTPSPEQLPAAPTAQEARAHSSEFGATALHDNPPDEARQETTPQNSEAEQLNTPTVIGIAQTITIKNESLAEIYQADRLDEIGMRRVVDCYLRGEDATAAFENERVRYESRFERDPQLRHKSYPIGAASQQASTSVDPSASQTNDASTSASAQNPLAAPKNFGAQAKKATQRLGAEPRSRRFSLAIIVVAVYVAIVLLLIA
jgi:hypothetical protein